MKWLRDNTGMREDCVHALQGSSARDMEEARKELAGRRGRASDSDRLMPMSFRAFCVGLGTTLPNMPTLRPRDFLSGEAEEAVYELLAWLDSLVSLWEVFCRVVGSPRAVASYLHTGESDQAFVNDLWDVIHGDALQRENFSAAQSLQLLHRLVRNLASPVNMTAVAQDIGVGTHTTARRRVKDLIDSYHAWPCYKRGDGQLPNLAAQEKIYLSDPLVARIPRFRAEQPEPDTSQISERRVGLALNLNLAAGDPGRYGDFSSVMYARSSTGSEVDFCGAPLGQVAFEGKYTDRNLGRETQTMRAMFNGKGVLATRAKVDDIDGARAIPVAFIAVLLD